MPIFAYSAVDYTGRQLRGKVKADSREAAEQRLQEQGLHATQVAPTADGVLARLSGLRRVKLRELVIFSRQFATMINAGMNLMKCLDVLRGQTADDRLRDTIDAIRHDVQAGQSLTDAMSKHPGVFNALYVNMIRAAEAAGILDQILNRLAAYLEKEMETASKVKSAMVYPTIVLVFAVGMTAVLVFFILPKFKAIFEDLDVDMPVTTAVLLNSSDYAVKYFYVPPLLLVGTIIGYRAYAKTPQGRYQIDSLKLKIPIIGDLIRKVAISRFTRTFSTLVRSGIPTPAALDIVAATSGNKVVEDVILQAKKNVMQGEKLSTPLMIGGVFPDMVTQMIAVGEETGRLDEMLNKISDFYDTEIEAVIKGLTSIIEPVLIVVMGSLVGFVAVSVISPIYSLVGQAGAGKL